ncbi:MAG: NAD(P)-binding protein [Actinomycetota bacterium]|nr:NAD(P)-binding protein [Actinomycetota bacterium]
MADCDTVVKGAGPGGLSATAFLAVTGKRTLLLERNYVPGGYATTFNRGRFEFEASLHELSVLGHDGRRGPLWRTMEECGVAHKVEFLETPDFYCSILLNLDIVIPSDRKGFEEVLCEHFPGEEEGIKRFSSIMFDLYEKLSRFSREGQEALASDPSAFSNMIAYS